MRFSTLAQATREECDALAAMVEQLMTDCADLGSKLNAKSSALAAAQAQLQVGWFICISVLLFSFHSAVAGGCMGKSVCAPG